MEAGLGRVADDEVAVAVEVDAVRQDEFARALALAADRGQVLPVGAELLDAGVAGVEDVDVPVLVDGDVGGIVEGDVLVLGVDVPDLADELERDPGGFAPQAAFDVVDDADAVDRLDLLSRGRGDEGEKRNDGEDGEAEKILHGSLLGPGVTGRC